MEGLSEESSWRALLFHRIECIDRSNIFTRHRRRVCMATSFWIGAMRHVLMRGIYVVSRMREHSQSRVSQRRGTTQAGTGFFKSGIVMSNELEKVDLGDAALPLSIDFEKQGGES